MPASALRLVPGSTFPPRYLPETKLLGFGARVEHEAFLQIPANVSPQALVEKYRVPLRAERVRLRTVADDQRNLTNVLTRLTGYLGLVALIALLLGGIGVASAVIVFVRQRSDSVAVLRCLGASAAYDLRHLFVGSRGDGTGRQCGRCSAGPTGAASSSRDCSPDFFRSRSSRSFPGTR